MEERQRERIAEAKSEGRYKGRSPISRRQGALNGPVRATPTFPQPPVRARNGVGVAQVAGNRLPFKEGPGWDRAAPLGKCRCCLAQFEYCMGITSAPFPSPISGGTGI